MCVVKVVVRQPKKGKSNSGQLPLVGHVEVVGHLTAVACAWIYCGTFPSSWKEDQLPGRVKSGDW